MKTGNAEVHLLSDGYFTLDAGAFFGIVPKVFWSRRFQADDDNRVRLALNVPLIRAKGWSALIDSGIGSNFDEKFSSIFKIDKRENIIEQISVFGEPSEIGLIVHSHLHFDHMGHSFEKNGGKPVFENAVLVAQEEEFSNLKNTNELTRSSYPGKNLMQHRGNRKAVTGSVRIKDGLKVVRTGGHTSGHQVVLFEDEKKFMYFGDLIPTTFHLRLPYVTAIDTFPLDTLKMKKKLIQKAIDEKYICIFNHDTETKAAYLSGEASKVEIDPVDID